ncbi:MAG: general secretion pathway protein GspJ [Sorangium cellulosum]|nr:MAG: general secretion pathway protein GspJ [Sorangium cellulosum]
MLGLQKLVSRRHARGLTLLEILVSVAILAMVSVLIYGAFDGMTKAKSGVSRVNQRYREGRLAIRRLAREIPSAFLSAHQPLNQSLIVQETIFIGENSTPADRLDFTSFSHRRFLQDTHESDQNELSYFGSRDPDIPNKTDLARREQNHIDLEANRGGSVQVLAEDIDLFDLEYLDPLTGMWQERWDSTSSTGQLGRLPLQVKVTLVLRNGPSGRNIPFAARIPLAMQTPLSFAIPR